MPIFLNIKTVYIIYIICICLDTEYATSNDPVSLNLCIFICSVAVVDSFNLQWGLSKYVQKHKLLDKMSDNSW